MGIVLKKNAVSQNRVSWLLPRIHPASYPSTAELAFSIHTSEVDGLLRGTVRRVRHRGVNLQVPDIASVFLQNL